MNNEFAGRGEHQGGQRFLKGPSRDLYGTLRSAKRRAGESIPCLPVRIKTLPGS